MRKSYVIVSIVLLVGIVMQAQVFKGKNVATPHLLNKIWIKVLCMNKWIDGRVYNTSLVNLRENSQTGSVIRDAKVMVNGSMLTFNSGIQEYSGNIGALSPGQKIQIKISTPDGRIISGYVKAAYFVSITKPTPFASSLPDKPIPVKWRFSNSLVYQVVFKILKNESPLFSTDINGSSYFINLGGIRLPVLSGDTIKAQVISPWSDVHHFLGPIAPGSKGQFFTSAAVSIRINH